MITITISNTVGKKPVPLPRSKIPLPTKSATMDRLLGLPQHQQPELRTFKRSKTDLSLGQLYPAIINT